MSATVKFTKEKQSLRTATCLIAPDLRCNACRSAPAECCGRIVLTPPITSLSTPGEYIRILLGVVQ